MATHIAGSFLNPNPGEQIRIRPPSDPLRLAPFHILSSTMFARPALFSLLVASLLLVGQVRAFRPTTGRSALRPPLTFPRQGLALNVFTGGDGEEDKKDEDKPSVEISPPKEENEDTPGTGFKLDYDPNTKRNFLGLREDYMEEQMQDPAIVGQLAFSVVLYGLLGYYVIDTIRLLIMKH